MPIHNLTLLNTLEIPTKVGSFTNLPVNILIEITRLLDIKHLSKLLATYVDPDSLENLLIAEIDPNVTDEEGHTLLALAIEQDRNVTLMYSGLGMFEELTPERYNRFVRCIMLLLQYNADPSIPNDENRLLLDFASFVLCKDEKVCNALYDKGAKITQVTPFGRICACQSPLSIKKLIDNGTNIASATDCYGEHLTILHSVMSSSRFNIPANQPVLDLLLETAPELLEKPAYDGRTPLHNAATRGSEELVCYLLNKGANAEALSMYYQIPLVCEMRARAVGIVRLLFTKVGSIHPRPLPQNYQSPLSAALYGIAHSDGRFNLKSLQIARILLDHDRTIMDDECNALIKGIRLRQMPAECREDLKAILRISGISQAQETGPSHTGLLEHGMLLRFAIYLLIIALGVRVILALRSETALF